MSWTLAALSTHVKGSPVASYRQWRQHATGGRETHIAEIKIDGTRLIPVFLIPSTHDDNPTTDDEEPAEHRSTPRFAQWYVLWT